MAVIYLPEDQRAAAFGKALGNVASGVYRGETLKEAQGLPEDQQLQFLQGRLGQEGADMVANLTRLKASQAEMARANADTKLASVNLQLKQYDLAHADEDRHRQDQLFQLQMQHQRLLAAGEGARAQETGLRIQELKQEITNKQKQQSMRDAIMPEALKLLGDATAGAAQRAPTAQPQSFEAPMPTGTASARTIGDSGTPTPATALPNATGDEAQLQFVQAYDKGHADIPIPDSGAGHVGALQQGQKMEMLGGLAGLPDVEKFGRSMKESNQPREIIDVDTSVPGVKVKAAVYADGTVHPIPGTVQDKREKVSDAEFQSANGLALFYQTSQTLKELNKLSKDPKADVLGPRAVRQLDTWLQQHKFTPTGAADSRSIKEAYNTVYNHAVIAATSMLRGTRQSQWLEQQTQMLAPNPLEPEEVRKQKADATEQLVKVMTMETYLDAVQNGKHVPAAISELYDALGLQGENLASLRQAYTASLGPAADHGAVMKIMDQDFPLAEVKARADARGMTPEQYKAAIESAKNQKVEVPH